MKKILLALCLFVVLLTGCSSKSDTNHYTGSYAVTSEEAKGDYAEAEQAPQASNSGISLEQSDTEKLVYTGWMSVETKDMNSFLKEFAELVRQYQGITQNMSENNYGNRRNLSLTLRVPAKDFESFIEALRSGSGSITNIHTNVENITRRYNDNEIEIEALETQHARLLELMAQAEDLSDIILIEEKLTDVETRLNILKSYRSEMDEDVAYSTIDIEISEVKTYTRTSFGQRLKEAFEKSWIDFADGMGNFFISLVYYLPVILLLAVLCLILRKPVGKLFSKLRRGRKKETTE